MRSKTHKLEYEEIQSILYYDETSPSCLRWKVDRFTGKHYTVKTASAGDVAGTISKSKGNKERWQVTIKNRVIHVPRVVVCLCTKENIPQDVVVDHIDRNTLNNKIDNLRLVSNAVNTRNAKMKSTNKSGVTGVHAITRNGKIVAWAATWSDYLSDTKYKTKRKSFFISVIGSSEECFNLAVEYRRMKIKELNELNLGYTDSHGL